MKNTVEILIRVCDNLGLEYRTNYSGRGMYGASCFGIDDCCMADLFGVIVKFLQAEYSENFQNASLIDFSLHLQEIFEELADYSQDSMGQGTIHYWPRMEMPEEIAN